MSRSLVVVVGACAVSAAMMVGLGTGVAEADAVGKRHPRPTPSKVDTTADTDEAQLSHLHHLTQTPKGRERLWDYLRHSI